MRNFILLHGFYINVFNIVSIRRKTLANGNKFLEIRLTDKEEIFSTLTMTELKKLINDSRHYNE